VWIDDPEGAAVVADPDRVGQALDNMIDNALRHGGLRVCVDADLCANGVRIAVSDSGGAIRRPRSSEGGSRHGHGLRIVSGVAAEHGGRFQLSQTLAGTVATIELPLAPQPLPAAVRAREPAGAGSSAPTAPPLRAAA
jgi:signal transduction histidine kinase